MSMGLLQKLKEIENSIKDLKIKLVESMKSEDGLMEESSEDVKEPEEDTGEEEGKEEGKKPSLTITIGNSSDEAPSKDFWKNYVRKQSDTSKE